MEPRHHEEPTLQQCSDQWVEKLSRAAEELNGAAKQIQAEFAAVSVRSVSNGKYPIPDLVIMKRRIQQLETTMTHLQRACKEIAAKRKVVLPKAYEQISVNQQLLSQLMLEMKLVEPLEEKCEGEALREKLRSVLASRKP